VEVGDETVQFSKTDGCQLLRQGVEGLLYMASQIKKSRAKQSTGIAQQRKDFKSSHKTLLLIK